MTPSLGGQFNVTIDELFSATGIATFYRCKKMNNSIWPYADGGPVDLYEVETFLICKPELYEKESFPAVSGPIFLVNAASGNEQARYYDLRECFYTDDFSFYGWNIDTKPYSTFQGHFGNAYYKVKGFNQPSSWAADSVNKAISADLVPKTIQGRYTLPTTRAEFCALATSLYESYIGTITEQETFTDTWDPNVEKMAALKVVNGVGDNRFAPNDKLTRKQAATMLARLAAAMGVSLEGQAYSFADRDKISSWAQTAVGQMQSSGIMGGVGNNMFSPSGDYTREQSIVTIMRLREMRERTRPSPGSDISLAGQWNSVGNTDEKPAGIMLVSESETYGYSFTLIFPTSLNSRQEDNIYIAFVGDLASDTLDFNYTGGAISANKDLNTQPVWLERSELTGNVRYDREKDIIEWSSDSPSWTTLRFIRHVEP